MARPLALFLVTVAVGDYGRDLCQDITVVAECADSALRGGEQCRLEEGWGFAEALSAARLHEVAWVCGLSGKGAGDGA